MRTAIGLFAYVPLLLCIPVFLIISRQFTTTLWGAAIGGGVGGGIGGALMWIITTPHVRRRMAEIRRARPSEF